MASRFLPEILAVEPTSPYLLGGYSFGGLVAFELARQLTEAGREIRLVAMIDAWGRGSPRKLSDPQCAWDHLRAITLSPAGSRLAYVRERLARKYPRKQELSGVAISKPFENINHQAGEIYQPKPYLGRIVISRASEHPVCRALGIGASTGGRDDLCRDLSRIETMVLCGMACGKTAKGHFATPRDRRTFRIASHFDLFFDNTRTHKLHRAVFEQADTLGVIL